MDTRGITIRAGATTISGDMTVPPGARGIVLFAHGSGSSRHSPRNRRVASALNQGGLATLLVDLLTPEEERRDATSGEHRFDIDLLAERLVSAIDWVVQEEEVRSLHIGLFGASTGAAAALLASTERADVVGAVVSRGGRPDLAGPALPEVAAPTLLIVGGHDVQVLALNQQAMEHLGAEKRLDVVHGATHLFEEPGALDRVSALARSWFEQHLTPAEMRLPSGEPVHA